MTHPLMANQIIRPHGLSAWRVAAGALALLLAGAPLPACAIQGAAIQAPTAGARAAASDGSKRFRILHTRLRNTHGGTLFTDAGAFQQAPGCQLFLRHGVAVRRVDDLGAYSGLPLTLRLVKGKAVWAVVETKEALR